MSEEIEYIDPELNEFERELKSRLTVKKEDEKNLQFLKEFLEKKKNETTFIHIGDNIQININPPNNPVGKDKSTFKKRNVLYLIITSIIITSIIIFFLLPPEPVQQTLKATYHIAYFEDIEIIDKLSKDLNLSENEYAKFIFYKAFKRDTILFQNGKANLFPTYEKVEFTDLSHIFRSMVENLLNDTTSKVHFVFVGNMPETPQDIIKNGSKLKWIIREQFQKLSKKNNLSVKIILKDEKRKEIGEFIEKFEENNIKYEIIK